AMSRTRIPRAMRAARRTKGMKYLVTCAKARSYSAAACRSKTSSSILEPRNSFADGRFALLRAHRERPRRSRAAEQRDELATAAHSIISSARASRDNFKLVLRFFHCTTWGVRDDTSSPTLAVRLASIHPFATCRIERVLIPFVRPIAERIAKPWSFRLEGRQA